MDPCVVTLDTIVLAWSLHPKILPTNPRSQLTHIRSSWIYNNHKIWQCPSTLLCQAGVNAVINNTIIMITEDVRYPSIYSIHNVLWLVRASQFTPPSFILSVCPIHIHQRYQAWQQQHLTYTTSAAAAVCLVTEFFLLCTSLVFLWATRFLWKVGFVK